MWEPTQYKFAYVIHAKEEVTLPTTQATFMLPRTWEYVATHSSYAGRLGEQVHDYESGVPLGEMVWSNIASDLQYI